MFRGGLSSRWFIDRRNLLLAVFANAAFGQMATTRGNGVMPRPHTAIGLPVVKRLDSCNGTIKPKSSHDLLLVARAVAQGYPLSINKPPSACPRVWLAGGGRESSQEATGANREGCSARTARAQQGPRISPNSRRSEGSYGSFRTRVRRTEPRNGRVVGRIGDSTSMLPGSRPRAETEQRVAWPRGNRFQDLEFPSTHNPSRRRFASAI